MSQLSVFLNEFARDPVATGAVAPSSAWLARQMVVPVPERGDPLVIEVGPGGGAFTRAIRKRLDGRGHHLAVELNPRFAALLTRQFPGLDLAVADALELPELIAERGLGKADAVISGLPWTMFGVDKQRALLGAMAGALATEGAFTTFAYVHARWSPPARRFHERLREAFEEVVVGRTVWRNLPPALVYHARRPR
ncbi:MAG: SAM-dependent methyltransferase [Streptosporangiales bacterium]|nr:SAM-dependent methyltransferase [Streptosporangiales bacterium]